MLEAVNDVRAEGRQVTEHMIQVVYSDVSFTQFIPTREEACNLLLREVAVQAAMEEVSQGETDLSNTPGPTWAKYCEARGAAGRVGKLGGNYDAMFDSALRALSSDQLMYVVVVNRYKQVGVDLELFLSSLGEQFSLVVNREATVAHVAYVVQQERLRRRPEPPGKKIKVKLVSPAGAVFLGSQLIKNALDVDGQVLVDDEDGVFYPLSVLTGQEWRQLGLHAPTRWKHLREKEFSDLFGMNKSAFEKLPDWKQIPLKKKHGLF